jgi:polysaccharide pyruvyl transferase WcaK-like protein
MHACIAALSQGVPCAGVAYSKKFVGVFESIGVADWVVDGRSTANEAAVQAVVDLYRQRAVRRGLLNQQVLKAKTDLKEIFSQLVSYG